MRESHGRGNVHAPRPSSKPDTCVQTTSHHHVELAKGVGSKHATEPSPRSIETLMRSRLLLLHFYDRALAAKLEHGHRPLLVVMVGLIRVETLENQELKHTHDGRVGPLFLAKSIDLESRQPRRILHFRCELY